MDATAVAAELEAAAAPALVTHRHADRDAVGAAIGLAALLERRRRSAYRRGSPRPRSRS